MRERRVVTSTRRGCQPRRPLPQSALKLKFTNEGHPHTHTRGRDHARYALEDCALHTTPKKKIGALSENHGPQPQRRVVHAPANAGLPS